jgi:uncharacterized protein YukE
MGQISTDREVLDETTHQLGQFKEKTADHIDTFKRALEGFRADFSGLGYGEFVRVTDMLSKQMTEIMNDLQDLETKTKEIATRVNASDDKRAGDLHRTVTGGAGNAVALPQ